jgi:2-dehydro-3-deoxygluconokinase
MPYDLISLGEPLLRLSPPRFGQLRCAGIFDAVVVGSQLNIAADLAQLGWSTAFLTKVPDHAIGQLALETIRGYGVDTAHIIPCPQGRLGVTYVEFSADPRPPIAVYDRQGSAASTISAVDFDWDMLLPQTSYAYCDGIFPGLSQECCEATLAFLAAAQRYGVTTAFDLNYREHLWTPDTARASWQRLLPLIDILVTNRSVSEMVFEYTGDDAALARRYLDQFGCRVVCMTSRELLGLQRGAWNSKAYCHDGTAYRGQRREFDIVDRYGTGDAWFAGFLYGYAACGVEYGLQFGNALCALAHTIMGDIAHVMPSDVTAIMSGGGDLRVKR